MKRITSDEVYFDNIPYYGSNIVIKNSGGLGGEIYFNLDEIDFFWRKYKCNNTNGRKGGI